MTIRKQLTLIISSIMLMAVLVYSLMSTAYVKNYFSGYVESEYEQTVERIKEQAVKAIKGGDSEVAQSEETMSVYLSNLIEQISVLDEEGNVVLVVRDAMPMMRNQMMGRQGSETDYLDIEENGQKMGTLVIERSSKIRDSETVLLFRRAQISGAVVSGLVALAVSILVIIITGSKMTKDLRRTAEAAGMADSDSLNSLEPSKILEIRAIQQSLESLSAKLKLQKRTRKEKVDQISHEVRTPLTILKTNCEGARDRIIEMDDSRLESCLAEIDHLSLLLENISDVVEYESADVKIDRQELDIAEHIKLINKGFVLQYEKKGISLSCEGEKHLLAITDKALLSQAVYNLISNAYKFTPKGGKVVVSVFDSGDSVLISVCDNGPGVPDKDKKRIFEAYQRGSGIGSEPGEGLGLFIAKKNVEALDGAISLKDSPLGGTCFEIEIPKGRK